MAANREMDLSPYGVHAPAWPLMRLIRITRNASSSWAGRRKAYFLSALAIKLLREIPVDITALGVRLRLYPSRNLCEKRLLFTPQYFDPAERAFLAARMKPDFTFVDIGASVGGYALSLAAVASPGTRILAIEPQPLIYKRLLYNIGQNNFPTIKPLDCAVTGHEGDVILTISRNNYGETTMMGQPSSAEQTVSVRAKNLTALLADEKFARIDAMKLDCEGAEKSILESFFRDSARALWPEVLIIEYKPQGLNSDLPAIVASLGYCEVLRTRQNLIFELPAEEARP